MKMGTIVSPSLYDAAAAQPLRLHNLRRPAILLYASRAAVFPTSQDSPVTLRQRPSRSNLRNDTACQIPTSPNAESSGILDFVPSASIRETAQGLIEPGLVNAFDQVAGATGIEPVTPSMSTRCLKPN